MRLARPDERRRWDATMAEQHPLGFRGFAGRGLRYVAEYQGCWLALIGWQSGAFKCRPRDLWIGWRQREQFPRLHLIANNTRMLMLCPPGTIPNLASCVMAANLRRLSCDWLAHFGHPLELAETFVDPAQFGGTMYRAGNWIFVGRTRGFARSNGRYTEPHGCHKVLCLYTPATGRRRTAQFHQPCPSCEPQHPRVARCPVTLFDARVQARSRDRRDRAVPTRGSCRQSATPRAVRDCRACRRCRLAATRVRSLGTSCAPWTRGASSAPGTTMATRPRHPPAGHD